MAHSNRQTGTGILPAMCRQGANWPPPLVDQIASVSSIPILSFTAIRSFACSRGIVQSFAWRHAQAEIGSDPIRRLRDNTAEHTFAEGHAVRVSMPDRAAENVSAYSRASQSWLSPAKIAAQVVAAAPAESGNNVARLIPCLSRRISFNSVLRPALTAYLT